MQPASLQLARLIWTYVACSKECLSKTEVKGIGAERLARTVLVHEWAGLLIAVVAVASLAGTVWSIVQNAFFYQCPVPVPVEIHDTVTCPTLAERIGWNIRGLIIGCVILLFGLWTYMKGKKGVPLISIRSFDRA